MFTIYNGPNCSVRLDGHISLQLVVEGDSRLVTLQRGNGSLEFETKGGGPFEIRLQAGDTIIIDNLVGARRAEHRSSCRVLNLA